MKRKELSYLFIPITINIVIVLMEIGALIACVYRTGLRAFIFYTILSNIFGGFTSGFMVYYLIQKYKNFSPIPNILVILKLESTCCLAVTFLVVIFVLSWTVKDRTPIQLIFCESNLVQHLLGPILSIISFILWEIDFKLPYKYCFFCLMPTLIYGAVLIPANIARVWIGPYPFLKVHEQSVGMSIMWITIIILINFATAYLLAFCTNSFKCKSFKIKNKNQVVDISESNDASDEVI